MTTTRDPSPQRVAAFALHAGSLASRTAALPAPTDPDAARRRQERVERLRWAAAAGAALAAQAQEPDTHEMARDG